MFIKNTCEIHVQLYIRLKDYHCHFHRLLTHCTKSCVGYGYYLAWL